MENAHLTKEKLLQKINSNTQWENAYLRLSQEWQNKFLNFCIGTGTLPLTYDPFFKKIFDREAHPERLFCLLSLILGKELTVHQVLPNESTRIIEEGSQVFGNFPKQNKIEGELDAWMHLLSSNNRDVHLQIAGQYPHIKDIYEEVIEFRQDIEGVLFMFSDALRILDRNTVQLIEKANWEMKMQH